jgi:hypothetical protein
VIALAHWLGASVRAVVRYLDRVEQAYRRARWDR